MASPTWWHEFEEALGDGEGQGSLECCSPWGRKELDMTEWPNNNIAQCWHSFLTIVNDNGESNWVGSETRWKFSTGSSFSLSSQICPQPLFPVWTIQVALVVTNPHNNTEDKRGVVSIPGLRRSLGGRHGNPLQYSCLENPKTKPPGGLQSIASQRVRQN